MSCAKFSYCFILFTKENCPRSLKYQVFNFITLYNDMVKHESRVESLKARVKIQKH